jgi:hypothetical protein
MSTVAKSQDVAKPTASAPAAAVAPQQDSVKPPATPQQDTDAANYRLPEKVTLENAVKWAIIEDRPIMMDYWADSLEKKVMIGVRENGEKLLVKNAEEYTSPIAKIFKHNTDYIVMTENSIYLVDSTIPIRRIS